MRKGNIKPLWNDIAFSFTMPAPLAFARAYLNELTLRVMN